MKKFKLIKQKFIDILCKINDYYVTHLWIRILLDIFYYFIFALSLLILSGYWLNVFNESICGEDIICCILSYFTFYVVMYRLPNDADKQ